MRGSMRSIRPRAYALPACLVGLAVAYWAVISSASVEYIQPRGSFSDFAHFYAAARAVRMSIGPGLYSPALLVQIDQLPGGCAGTALQIPYINPPLLAILFQPFTALSCGDALRVWRLISIAMWVAVTVLLAWQVWQRCARRGASPARSALAAAFIIALSAFSYPVLDGLWLGQVNLLLLGGIVLAWWLRERNQPIAAGMILAAITLIKLIPAVLIVYFLLRRDWRVLLGAAVGTVLLFGVMLVGAGGLPTLVAMIPALTSASGLMPSVNTAVIRLNPVLGPTLVAGAALTFVITVLLIDRRGWTKADPALGYAWAISTMLVISPIVWLHYLTWLIIVVAACLPYVQGRAHVLGLGAVSVSLLLSTPPLLGAATVATLLCWVLTGVLYVQSMHPSEPAPQRQPVLAGAAPIP